MQRLKVYRKTNGKCWYCGKKLNTKGLYLINNLKDSELYDDGDNRNNFSIDHVIPKEKCNYTNNINNLVPCCKSCNTAKNTKTLEQFRKILVTRKFKEKFGVSFTNKQEKFLKSMGFYLPIVDDKFYFEKQGLERS
jgi:5-methylcytosine-specific restriction endonuclease McrA